MQWNKNEIENHKKAAELLDKIKDSALELIKNTPGITEYQVQQYIKEEFNNNNLLTDRDNAIVAFRENTGFVHYYPAEDCKKLEPETLIMIDLWAKVDDEETPFADITWGAYYGNNPDSEILKIFNQVIKARDAAIKFIRKNLKQGKLPIGKEIDDLTRKVLTDAGYGDQFPHTTGHSLGFDSPHGKEFGLNWKNVHPLQKNLGYTIEPGIYFENKFGMRSEIDFYIDNKLELVITSKVQKELIIL